MTSPWAGRPLWPLQAVVGVLIAFRLYVDFTMPPIGDEAYYWLWGQRPALSYFDHPPLHAWLLWGVEKLFGWNLLSLRILTWVTLGATLAIVWDWSKRLAPAEPHNWFWPATAIYLASPLFLAMTTISFHDHLLIALCLGSGHCFILFAERYEGGRRSLKLLYGGAVLLGLATLTKYNAVLFGIGIGFMFLVRPKLRAMLADVNLWAAAALSMAMQAPVFIWNFAGGMASYRFHMVDRWGGGGISLQPMLFLGYVALTLIVVSPFLVGPIIAFLRRPVPEGFGTVARTLAICVFAAAGVAMSLMALFVEVYFYWNIVAFLLMLPLLVSVIGRRKAFWGHTIYGLVFGAGLAFHLTVIPITNLLGGYDWTISSMQGWPEVAEAITELEAEHPGAFIAATRYTTAAQLGWAMQRTDVTAIAARTDQFDYWFDAEAHRGRSALVVADPMEGESYATGRFETLTPLRRLEIVRFGRVVYTPIIFLGQNYRPPSP
ncbi:Dolichyl-phosphate-mannose-protein mannosyltransferase [Devosia enhydra]|uniref:Dolichyl-phosphate-mannose-protein mannosyltransferase n=1 Tax=Devosia enhydra TaxID=665118 RepID=A0A1K2HTL8_9HYPH|nr:glycosyltransferase family 39 protein [Devosia enhydra]SFZ81590.1 Dolichyl-phosphate-mannose-protein mannosyltransferase [Devosia enhydra]